MTTTLSAPFGLQFVEQIQDPAVQNELIQLVSSLQTAWGKLSPVSPSIGDLSAVYSSHASKVAAQSIPNTTHTALTFDTNDFDNGIHNVVVNPTRFTAPAAGKYLLVGQVGFTAAAVTTRSLFIRSNGVNNLAQHDEALAAAAGITAHVTQTVVLVNAASGDYFEFMAYQDSGGSQNTSPTLTWGSMVRVA